MTPPSSGDGAPGTGVRSGGVPSSGVPSSGVLEVIAMTVADGVAAQRGGADRLEVVSAMEADGLLPDLNVALRLRDTVSIPMRVMLRMAPGFGVGAKALVSLCRAGEAFRTAGFDQFVYGFLNAHSQLDLLAIETICASVAPRAWTLHRAFDHTADAARTFARCAELPGLDVILSAGGPGDIAAGLPVLAERAAWQTARLRWMAGGGLRLPHVAALRRAGISQFHSGRAVRRGQRWDAPVDQAVVRQLKEAILEPAPGN